MIFILPDDDKLIYNFLDQRSRVLQLEFNILSMEAAQKNIYKTIQNMILSKTQQQQTFKKLSRALTAKAFHPSQHNRMMSTISQQIKRPDTSLRMKKDYENLMDLADCNKRIVQSRQRSMMSYKKMKRINQNQDHRKYYQPLLKQIQNTQENLYKRKYKKYDIEKFKNYLNKSEKQTKIQEILQSFIMKGINDIKNYIPSQAKLYKKLCIFGQLIQEQKEKHIEEIKSMIMRQKQKTPDMTKNYQIYLINHYLVQKLMMKIYADSSAIQNKNRYSQTYEEIKNQMVSEIIKEKGFGQVLKMMEKHCQNEQKRRSVSKNKIYESARCASSKQQNKRKIKRFASEFEKNNNTNKQNEITTQFYKLCEQAENKLECAKKELNFVGKKNNFF